MSPPWKGAPAHSAREAYGYLRPSTLLRETRSSTVVLRGTRSSRVGGQITDGGGMTRTTASLPRAGRGGGTHTADVRAKAGRKGFQRGALEPDGTSPLGRGPFEHRNASRRRSSIVMLRGESPEMGSNLTYQVG